MSIVYQTAFKRAGFSLKSATGLTILRLAILGDEAELAVAPIIEKVRQLKLPREQATTSPPEKISTGVWIGRAIFGGFILLIVIGILKDSL